MTVIISFCSYSVIVIFKVRYCGEREIFLRFCGITYPPNDNIVFLNKKHALFRPAPVSYGRGYYFENQGLMFLKFMFLICGTLLYLVDFEVN